MDASPGGRPRLNLFAFPSDADFRFALLVASVLGAALLLYADLFETLPPTARARQAVYAACTALDDPDDLSAGYEELVGRYLRFGQCVAPADRGEAAWMVGGATLVVAAAAGLYWAMPAWRIRRQRLRPLDADVGPDVLAAIDELVAEAGLTGRPHFLWDPLDASADGLAFGRLGRRCVALTGGLVMQFYSDRPAFRAVVLHELGHLRNADLDKTYLTVAVWWAFLGLAVAPAIVARLAFSHARADLARLAWLVLPLAALVRLTRDAVLRARAVRRRAGRGLGRTGRRARPRAGRPGRPARAALAAGPAGPPRAGRAAPGAGRQPAAVAHGRLEALAAGAAAGVALPNLVVLLGLLIPFSAGLARPLLAALVLAPLAVGVVGLGIWRQTFAELAAGDRPIATGRLALGLAVGFVLGENLTFAASQLARGAWMIEGPALIVLELGWGALLLLALWPFSAGSGPARRPGSRSPSRRGRPTCSAWRSRARCWRSGRRRPSSPTWRCGWPAGRCSHPRSPGRSVGR